MSVAFQHHHSLQMRIMDEEHIHQPFQPIRTDPDQAQDQSQPSSSCPHPSSQPKWFTSSGPCTMPPTLVEQKAASDAFQLHHPSVPPSFLSRDHPHCPPENDPTPTSSQPLSRAAVEPTSSLQPDDLFRHHAAPSIKPLPICQPASTSPVQASGSEAAPFGLGSPSSPIVLNQLAQTEPTILDGDENTASSIDHASTLLDDEPLAQVDLESIQHPEEELDCEAQWDNNRLVDDIPYEDYELDSRPKVRTDLLEHVRVEFEAVSLHDQDQGLSTESDLAPPPSVTLICEGCEYSLFRRTERCSDSDSVPTSIDNETVLLSEPECRELYYGPLEAFIQSLHNIFPNLHDNNKNEIVLHFPALEIKVPEDNIYSKEISLFDIDRLHMGARLLGRLLISLEKQPRLVHRFNVLATYVSELVENNATIDGNSGEVFIEDSDKPDDSILVDHVNDTDEPEISEESGVPEGSSAFDAPFVTIATDQPEVFHTTEEESPSTGTVLVITSSRDEKRQPTSTFATVDSSVVDGLSSACAPNYAALGNSAREQLEITTDDSTVMDESSAAALIESHELSGGTDESADELSYDPSEKSLETLPEVVDEYLDPASVVDSNEEIFARFDTAEPLQNITKENVMNGVGSCSNSERTITGLDQLSEGEIEEFVEDREIPLDDDATLVHDLNGAPLNDELALGVAQADQHENSSAHLAPISDPDCITINLFSTDSSFSHVGPKRNHAEVEDSVDGFESTDGAVETLRSSDGKRARVL